MNSCLSIRKLNSILDGLSSALCSISVKMEGPGNIGLLSLSSCSRWAVLGSFQHWGFQVSPNLLVDLTYVMVITSLM